MFVLADDLAEELTETMSSLRDTVGSLPAVELWRTDAPIPFGLLVVTTSENELMAVECYRKDVLLGLVVNDSSESVRWATETVERYHEGRQCSDRLLERMTPTPINALLHPS